MARMTLLHRDKSVQEPHL